MLLSAKSLHGFTLQAIDGVIGRVKDVYFDSDRWTVRYLVVDTGGWLSDRRVLISPIALGRVHEGERRIDVQLTQDLVRKSPDIDADEPVSRQYEMAYYNHYGWPYYWAGAGVWGGPVSPQLLTTWPRPSEQGEPEVPAGDPNLRSADRLGGFFGYRVHTTDGDIGHVADFIVDEQTWEIRYLALETSNWGLGRKVLLPPDVVGLVSWEDASVCVGASRETIESARPWDGRGPIDRAFEKAVFEHFRRQGYWVTDGAPGERSELPGRNAPRSATNTQFAHGPPR